MKRALLVTSMAIALGFSAYSETGFAAPPKPSSAEPAPANSLGPRLEQHKWGMTQSELTRLYTETNGILWKDYDERLAKSRVGPDMTAIENEREAAKAAFQRSVVDFKDTPTGYDATAIRAEYTYRNHESVMSLQRKGVKRFFFFINDRLWKMYDEVQLSPNGIGATFKDVSAKLATELGAPGRVRPAGKDVSVTTVDWSDASTHLRLLDRSSEGLVAFVYEDNATLAKLPALRTNKDTDKFAMDPTVTSVTSGTNRTDPNAAREQPAPAPKPKKK